MPSARISSSSGNDSDVKVNAASGKRVNQLNYNILAMHFQIELFYNDVLNEECVTAASTGRATTPQDPPVEI